MTIKSMYKTALLWNGGLGEIHEYCWYREPSGPRLVLDRLKFFGTLPLCEEERVSCAEKMAIDSGIIHVLKGEWQYRDLTAEENRELICEIYNDLKD